MLQNLAYIFLIPQSPAALEVHTGKSQHTCLMLSLNEHHHVMKVKEVRAVPASAQLENKHCCMHNFKPNMQKFH